MYKKLLLAYNGSVAGQKALLESRELAQWGQAELHLVAVMPMALNAVVAEGIVFSTEQEAAHRKGFEQVLAQGLSSLADQGFAATGELLLGDPVHEICACANAWRMALALTPAALSLLSDEARLPGCTSPARSCAC